MALRGFPIIYASDVELTARFYERFGYERHFQLPADGDAGYVSMRREASELAAVSADWPEEHYGLPVGTEPRFEMFIYVDDVDAMVSALRDDGVTVLKEAADMPWGERVAFVTDPDGNPVAIAAAPAS